MQRLRHAVRLEPEQARSVVYVSIYIEVEWFELEMKGAEKGASVRKREE